MPKATFDNLSDERKAEIKAVCLKEFENKNIVDIAIGNICKDLGLTRPAFYKYFDNIEDCYYYLLSQANFDLHNLIFNVFNEKHDLKEAIELMPKLIADSLFDNPDLPIIKTYFLQWNLSLEKGWMIYQKKHELIHPQSLIVFEKIDLSTLQIKNIAELRSFMKVLASVVHDTIRDSFQQNWDQNVLTEELDLRLHFLLKGIYH